MSKIWTLLLALSGTVALWYTGQAALHLYRYNSLSGEGEAHIEQWGVRKDGASKFALVSNYYYIIDDKAYKGTTAFTQPYYLNLPSAEQEIQKINCQTMPVWFNPSKPQISSLHKEFPTKNCFNSVITLSIFIYFYFLKRSYII